MELRSLLDRIEGVVCRQTADEAERTIAVLSAVTHALSSGDVNVDKAARPITFS